MKSNRLNQLLDFLAASPNDGFILFAIAKEYEKYDDKEKALEKPSVASNQVELF